MQAVLRTDIVWNWLQMDGFKQDFDCCMEEGPWPKNRKNKVVEDAGYFDSVVAAYSQETIDLPF